MRRIRIALTGTLGLLGDRLARRLEGDGSCRRVVLLDLPPPAAEFRKARYHRVDLTEPSAHLDYLQFPCVADGSRARAELGFAPRHSTRDALVEFARTRLFDAA